MTSLSLFVYNAIYRGRKLCKINKIHNRTEQYNYNIIAMSVNIFIVMALIILYLLYQLLYLIYLLLYQFTYLIIYRF